MSYVAPEVATVHLPALVANLPQQSGATVAITGTTSGTGFHAAIAAASLGARVLCINRDSERAVSSLASLQKRVPGADFVHVSCDLQSMESARAAGGAISTLLGDAPLAVLALNSGIMAVADKATSDGYDQQMQVNCLAQWALVRALMPALERSGAARVVSHSSMARFAAPGSDGEFLEAKYFGKNGGQLGGDAVDFGTGRWVRYHQTKLANVVFTMAFNDRAAAAKSTVTALAAHPGLAATNLQVTTVNDGGMTGASEFMTMAQSAEDGACGLLSAMFLPEAKANEVWGPAKWTGAAFATDLGSEELSAHNPSRNLLWDGMTAAIGGDLFE